MTYTERKNELKHRNLEKLCLEYLGSPLVEDTDYELTQDEEYHSYKTEDDMFFFVPLLDSPVMSRTLLGEHPIPNRYHYAIETIQGDGGSYWEPPDYDQVEIGREDSLANAIGFAAKYLLDLKLNQFQEGAYWEAESILDKEFPNPY